MDASSDGRSARPDSGRLVAAPLPRWDDGVVVVEAPGDGPGFWAGAPSAVAHDGAIWIAYRLRRPVGDGRGYATVIARSTDGEHFEPVAELDRDSFGADSLERPALALGPDGDWRLYVSCATPGTLHWRVDLLEAADPAAFRPDRASTVLAGDPVTAWKDPVVVWSEGTWHMWACCHELGSDTEADRMFSSYATSPDGREWAFQGVALAGRPGHWDARGARITSVLLDDGAAVAYYDGRSSAAQNWEEQTGLAYGRGPECFQANGGGPLATSPNPGGGLRYVSVVRLPDGGHRLYYEATRSDGAHDLRTEYVPPSR